MEEFILFKYVVNILGIKGEQALEMLKGFEKNEISRNRQLDSKLIANGSVLFVANGLVGIYSKEKPSCIIDFVKGENLINDISHDPLMIKIVAIEKTCIYSIDRKLLDVYEEKFPSLKSAINQNLKIAFINSMVRIKNLLTLEAADRYKLWLAGDPDLVKRVPQYLVALYLGISPTSLSRIRKDLFRK